MARFHRWSVWKLAVLVALIPLCSLPPHVDAAQPIETLGWVLRFDLSQPDRVDATFHYLLRFRGSQETYDIGGVEAVRCAADSALTGHFSCPIPDMPSLLLKASNGTVDIRTMQLPLGALEACGTLVRPTTGKTAERTDTAILSTGTTKLYDLRLKERTLSLGHADRRTLADAPPATSRFHLLVPDTTLIAPHAYTLDIQPRLADHYALDELIVVDPGAFAHLADETCGTYERTDDE